MVDMMGAMAQGSGHGSAHGAGMSEMQPASSDAAPMAAMKPGAAQGTDHSGMAGMQRGAASAASGLAAPARAAPRVRHARTEYGPLVDMHNDMPRTNLDDPGPNLPDNGRRVLTYADLHTWCCIATRVCRFCPIDLGAVCYIYAW